MNLRNDHAQRFAVCLLEKQSNLSFGMPADTETATLLKNAGDPLTRFGTLFFDDGTVPFGGEEFQPRNFVFNTFAVNDIFTHIAGRHTLKFGFEFRRIQENSNYQLLTNPFYEFNSKFNFVNDDPYYLAATISREPGRQLRQLHLFATPFPLDAMGRLCAGRLENHFASHRKSGPSLQHLWYRPQRPTACSAISFSGLARIFPMR